MLARLYRQGASDRLVPAFVIDEACVGADLAEDTSSFGLVGYEGAAVWDGATPDQSCWLDSCSTANLIKQD